VASVSSERPALPILKILALAALLRCIAHSLISIPAANASWPALRKTTTRACGFSLTPTNRRCKWFHMSKVMALRRSGRLNVMVAIGPSICKSSG
jgi:hypothetical protein